MFQIFVFIQRQTVVVAVVAAVVVVKYKRPPLV